jgi:hypothetical protein
MLLALKLTILYYLCFKKHANSINFCNYIQIRIINNVLKCEIFKVIYARLFNKKLNSNLKVQ